jgi:hypothetical protein
MPRYASSLRQEDRSRNQIGDAFAAVGWAVDSFGRDLGEDLIVRIYHADEKPTGLTFYVQLKSTPDLSSHALQNGDFSYEFEIGKMLDWSRSPVPVCLVLWDVTQLGGRWVMVSDATTALDEAEKFSKRRANAKPWRSRPPRSKVSVLLPQQNDFSAEGFMKLKAKSLQTFAPVLEKTSDSMRLDFRFDSTPRGQEEQAAWNSFVETGKPVRLTAASVRAVLFEPYIVRLYDIPDFTPEGMIEIGPQKLDGEMTVRLDCFASDGRSASWPYLEFRPVRGGTREMLFSNQHQNVPVHFDWLVQSEGRGQWSWKVPGLKCSVRAVREAMEFMDVLSVGGKLRLSWLSSLPDGTIPPSSTIQVSPYVNEKAVSLCDPRFRDLLDKLCRIEIGFDRTLLIEGWKVDVKEISTIEELDAILATGRLTSTGQVNLEMKKGGLPLLLEIAKRDQPMLIRHLWPETFYSLLGERIDVGRHSQTTTGKLTTPAATIERALGEFKEEDSLQCIIENAQVVDKFPDCMSEEDAAQVWPDDVSFGDEEEC